MNQENGSPAQTGQLSVGGYALGFALAVLLTVLSFGLVLTGLLPRGSLLIVLALAAVAQMLVHLHYFLHLDGSKEMRWHVVSFGFTAILLFLFVAGTVWVMITLNSRMM